MRRVEGDHALRVDGRNRGHSGGHRLRNLRLRRGSSHRLQCGCGSGGRDRGRGQVRRSQYAFAREDLNQKLQLRFGGCDAQSIDLERREHTFLQERVDRIAAQLGEPVPLEVWALEIQTKKKAKNAYSITIERLLKRPTS